MEFSTAFELAIKARRTNGRRIGDHFYLSQQMVSDLKNGKKPVPHYLSPKLARHLDYPAVYNTLGLKANGGVGPVIHDGPRADHHRLVAPERVLVETEQAHQALDRIAEVLAGVIDPSQLDADGWKRFRVALGELADICDEAYNGVADLCLWSGESFGGVWDERKAELKAAGLIDATGKEGQGSAECA